MIKPSASRVASRYVEAGLLKATEQPRSSRVASRPEYDVFMPGRG